MTNDKCPMKEFYLIFIFNTHHGIHNAQHVTRNS
jgi:hypothetical protein